MKTTDLYKTVILSMGIVTGSFITVAQTSNSASDVKFTKLSEPVSNQSGDASQPASNFYHATYAGAAWGDYNNDGKLDLFYSDRNPLIDNSKIFSNLYQNNGDGTFCRILKSPFEATAFACPVWFDANGDGWLDMLLVGLSDYNYSWHNFATNPDELTHVSHLYISKGADANGNVEYDDITDSGILPIFNGLTGGKGHNWVSVGDYDKDGLTDVIMIGFDDCNRLKQEHFEEALRVVYLYKNIDGTHFELQRTPLNGDKPFHGLTDGSVVFSDLDGDGWLDILSTGYGYSRTSEIHIYWNNHNGTFTESTQQIRDVADSSSSIFDLNNDGLPDLVISGICKDQSKKYFYICKNLGNRTFEVIDDTKYEGIDGGQLSFGDVNQDGLPDILMSGHGATNQHTSLIYINQGDFNFDVYGAHYNDPFSKKGHFTRISHGSNALIDINNDGFLDAWLSGWSASSCSKGCDAEVWVNNSAGKGINANTAPATPSALSASYDGNTQLATFSWTAPTDDFTPTNGLRYNLYLRKKDSDKTCMVIPADITTGFVKTANYTNAIYKCFYQMEITADGEYEWGVQAIDNGNLGGNFATATAKFSSSGIDAPSAENAINVWSEGQNICFSSNDDAKMTVYNIAGQCIGTTSDTRSAHISVPNAGVYIAYVANATMQKRIKLIIK